MAFRGANRYDNSLAALRDAGSILDFVHPDYKYHKQDWDMIRDFMAGERRVKEMGQIYLPALGNDSGATYEEYKGRAVYVNMVARTVNGFVGTVFRRPLKIKGVSREKASLFDDVTVDGVSLNLFGKLITHELSSVGRVGVLLDREQTGRSAPYLTAYLAENILSWEERKIDGKNQLVYALLREIVANPRVNTTGSFFQPAAAPDQDNQLSARYRILKLDENGNYIQEVYETNDLVASNRGNQPTLPVQPTDTIRPTRNGQPLKFIPMVIIGPDAPGAEIKRSPVLDITTINAAHYRTSAQLEHGRFFTALPVYFVSKAPGGGEQGEYTVGPSVVWEVAQGEKPGILEYFGTGLSALTASLVEKEEAISQLGGRIMGIRAAATSEAESIFMLKQANEMAMLLNMTDSISVALTKVARWYYEWENDAASAAAVTVELNQDFKSLMIGAREMRAVALLYQEGIVPVDEVYRVFQDAEIIADDITVEEFKRMLDDPSQFPNQPNPDAMKEGWSSAQARDANRNQTEKLEEEGRQAEKDRQVAERAAERQNANSPNNSAGARQVEQFEGRGRSENTE